MFASKISNYAVVQWASRKYDAAKKSHAWFRYGAEKAEQLSSPVVAVLPKLPGATAVDSAAAKTVTRVEGLVATAQTQLTAAHACIAQRTDAVLTACEKFGARHTLAAWTVRTPLRMGDAVVNAVLPTQTAIGAAIPRVAQDAETHTLVEALDKHIDLAHTLRTHLAGKTLRQLLRESVRGSADSAVRLADWATDMLPADIQAAVRDAEGRKKNGFILYALRVATATTKFCAWTLPVRMLNAVRSESRRATAAVSTRAMHEMQELGTRGVQAADKARDAIRRRVTAATSAAFGRTGDEPSDEQKAANGTTAGASASVGVQADREHSD